VIPADWTRLVTPMASRSRGLGPKTGAFSCTFSSSTS
jgi:hypothetical protein